MKTDAIQVLLIEDDLGHARLARRAFERADQPFEVECATTLALGFNCLAARNVDVAVVDLTLPDSQGIETVVALRRAYPLLPIVVLTSLASDQIALDALAEGAQDYLLKDTLTGEQAGADLLTRSIRYAMHRQQSSIERQRILEEAHAQRIQLKKRANRRLSRLFRTAQEVVENVSHEFRTPLTVIKEYVSLVVDGMVGEVSEEQCRFLSTVADRAEDLNRMVDDMLDVSKLDAGMLTVRRTECQLSEIFAHVLPSLGRKAALKGVKLEVDVPENLPPVYCDADQVGRIVINLAVNAIKFSSPPGSVRVWIVEDETRQQLQFGITDNGPGIDQKYLEKIFERFTHVEVKLRDSTKGFGLGLSIAKELAVLNFGDITVQSTIQRGSTFACTVPIARPASVVRRFVQRRGQRRGPPSVVSVIVATATDPRSASQEEFELVLQHVIRSDDLLFRLSQDRWLLVAATGVLGAHKIMRRAQRALLDANKNRVYDTLSPLHPQWAGTWQTPAEFDGLLAHIQQLVDNPAQTFALSPSPCV